MSKSLQERFNDKYIPEPTSGCWLWTANSDGYGYGVITIGKTTKRSAHRVSYELHCGKIPNQLHVLHKCDNTFCVNPNHLFLGSHTDNMVDRDRKNRTAKGEQNGKSKLSNFGVRVIKRLAILNTLRDKEIANIFGVSRPTILHIKSGRVWSHI